MNIYPKPLYNIGDLVQYNSTKIGMIQGMQCVFEADSNGVELHKIVYTIEDSSIQESSISIILTRNELEQKASNTDTSSVRSIPVVEHVSVEINDVNGEQPSSEF